MTRIFILFPVFCILSFCSDAQDPSNNIIVQQATEEYRFIKGDKINPVKIKENKETIYSCNDFAASVQVVEGYNDQVEVNEVDIRVNGDKVKGFAPKHDYYSHDGIFYSDARVCYFNLPLEKKGTTSKVKFEKTILDPRYFTSIFFTGPHFTQKREVNVVVPKWMKIEIKEYNFKGYTISKQVLSKGEDNIYSYVIENAAPIKDEDYAPGYTYVAPHLLIMTKYAEPEGSRITYFNTLEDQYAWYRQLVKQIGNETPAIKAKAEEITKGLTDDIQKVKALYLWVQDNIRYIAYEDGIAGFKPEKAQEVLRKKYGDCKGMGNLMAEMLKSIGLDGRLCWLGTNHIAYDYSTPSLCVDNHMICAWIYKGKTYFLDATEKYIGFGEIAERIQGRQVLIENGDKYLLQNIPVSLQQQNTTIEKRTLAINGNNLEGKVIQIWKGESKEWLLSQINAIKKEKQEDVLKKFLSDGRTNYQINNLKVANLNDYNDDLKIEYDLVFKDAVSSFDKETYIGIDDRRDFAGMKFDTSKRVQPYLFPYKDHIVFEVELQLPKDAKPASLPQSFKVEQPEYSMQASYIAGNSRITYKREIIVKKTWIVKQNFTKWNADIMRLNEFYDNQLTITK
jgi:transglutaminase-like putative cysteine protease